MVFAAGLGTRLRPLTDDRPKALVEIQGRTLLEITLNRLRAAGVKDVVVNVHHFAEQIVAYLKSHDNLGLHVEISREDDLLLDTGGGLKKAAWFFQEGAARPDAPGPFGEPAPAASASVQAPDSQRATPAVSQPFVLHNVDVLTNIDLGTLAEYHHRHGALATLAVQDRASRRRLLFDDRNRLVGRAGSPRAGLSALAFSGVHVVSPRLLELLSETGVFSIIDAYLRLAAEGHKILAFRADQYYWRDLGRPADLEQAAADLKAGLVSIPSSAG
jgi:NDP-sugar pyrophosphorylase family protein